MVSEPQQDSRGPKHVDVRKALTRFEDAKALSCMAPEC